MSFTSDKIFTKIEKALKENGADISKEIQGIFEFQLKNKEGNQKTWQVDFNKQTVSSSSTSNADCTLVLSDKNCLGLMSGTIDATELFFSGDLEIKGDMSLAMKLGDLKEHLSKIPDTTATTTSSSSSGSSGSLTVDGFKSSEVFNKIYLVAQQSPEVAEGIDGTYEFQLTNEKGTVQSWTVDLKNKSVKLGGDGKAECTLIMSDKNYMGVMNGTTDATELFFGGEMQIKGDMGLAMKLGDLAETLKNVKVSSNSSPGASSATTLESTSGSSLAVEGFKASKIFDEINAGIKANPSIKNDINGIYEFKLSGGNGEVKSWTVDLKNEGKVYLGSPAKEADCTLEMSDKNCVAVMSGAMDATELFFSGELSIKGDMGLAMKLGQLKQPKSKL